MNIKFHKVYHKTCVILICIIVKLQYDKHPKSVPQKLLNIQIFCMEGKNYRGRK